MEIFWSKHIAKIDPDKESQFKEFVQKMANRLGFGAFRYGRTVKAQKYMTRMAMELKSYKKTGNQEHLFNIANYANLEYHAPENKKAHFDDKAESATRGTLGGQRENY